MIYLISFIEAFCSGLLGVNTVLYLKYVLGFSEAYTGWFLGVFGIVSSIIVISLGWIIDRIGPKKAMFIGSAVLIAARLLLSNTHTTNIAIALFILGVIGSAIKSSSVLVYIRQSAKSFKVDYVVFNLAFCLAGIAYDRINDYQGVYLIAGLVNLINLGLILKLPALTLIKPTTSKVIDWAIAKKVIFYNVVMMPISFIFTFMSTVLPKWVIEVLGKDAPVGKIYGSLNPFIILFMVPLYQWFSNKYKTSPYYNVIVGTTLSASSLTLVLLPYNGYYTTVIIAIILFTIGEAIWSPNNMEVGTTLCPPGEEGKYLTVSLLPRMLGGMFMGWFSSFTLTNFVYTAHPLYYMPFVLMSVIAMLTPLSLIIFKKQVSV